MDIRFIGDVILDVPEPDYWLSAIAPLLQEADVCIAHLEVPHTLSTHEAEGDVPAPGADPAHLDAIARAGIHAVSLAGNHMMDCGPEGLSDTISALDRLSIAHSGAGANLDDARRPAVVERSGRRIALLSYNCVGPEFSWATADRAGCAYVHVRTADRTPTRPQADLVEADPASLAAMVEDIAAARSDADLVIVAFHKGITHRPAELAPYERPVARAAIEAGADCVIGHHAHIARGIEFIRGKPVFHGLGNGCVVTHALSPAQDHPARAEWAERRKRMFGFEPDPAYSLAPFHPEAVNGMIGRLLWHEDGRIETSFLPLWMEPPGRPVPPGDKFDAVASYLLELAPSAGMPRLDAQQHGAWINVKEHL